MNIGGWGLIAAGVIPAILFGIGSVFQKASANSGITPSGYLAALCSGLFITAALALFIPAPAAGTNTRSLFFAGMNGLVWGVAYVLMMYAIPRYNLHMSKVISLVNMNTLVAVLLSLWVFAEWQDLHIARLLLGAALICAGGSLVASS